VILLLGLWVPRTAQGQAASLSAEELFAKGVERHQGGDVLGAVEAYQEALAKEPARVEARSNLGAAYVRLGRYQDAVEQYTKALETEPRQTRVRFNLGLALYKSMRIPDAVPELERVVTEDASNRAALLLLADCHLQMAQDAKVVTLLSPLEDELGEDRLFAYLLGSALLRRNELLRGQALIDRLFKGGETAEAHLLMGVAHMRREDAKSALPEFRKAGALNPGLATVHSLTGRALMETGLRAEATDAFRKELAGNPNDFDSNLYLGLLLKDENRLDESHDHLKRAARLRPQDPRVLYGLGSLHLAAGRVEEAEQALEAVTRQVPDYQQAHVLLATVYYRQKKKDLGDKERRIAEEIKARRQAQEPGAREELGAAYTGELPPDPSVAPPPGSQPR
jgi:tetratricopeptide (TPR) repeat protein